MFQVSEALRILITTDLSIPITYQSAQWMHSASSKGSHPVLPLTAGPHTPQLEYWSFIFTSNMLIPKM